MGVCCSKSHPETIQVKETKEVATSTSSLKDTSVQDVPNVSSDKESIGSEPFLPPVDTKIVRDDEEIFDTAAAQTHYSTFKHDREYDPVYGGSVYENGHRISQDDDHLKNISTRRRQKSEGGTTETKDFPKRTSLPEGTRELLDLEECFKGFDEDDMEKQASFSHDVVLEKEITHEEEEGRSFFVMCGNEKIDAEKESDSSSDGGECQEEGLNEINECPAEKTSLSLEIIDEGDEEVEATSLSKEESETESFFNVKGEMLSLFNRLEADASFIHSLSTGKEEDLRSTKSEDQPSNNGDSSMVREMETVFQELKQQYESNTSATDSDKSSEVDSFFDISKEIEDIISKFEQIQINSEENTSIMSDPDSPDSGSTLGELASRFENLVLQSDESGSDETDEDQGGQDEISKKESYFNMQQEIEFRLDLIRHGNVI